MVNEVRYSAFGETRYLNGETVTDLLYTGQKLDSYINLYWYGSRWYDASLGHFIQPDFIVPDNYNSLDWNRYNYVRYNPVLYNDPTGHNPWIIIPLIVWITAGGYSASTSLGLTPDVLGIARTEYATGKDEVSIEVAAGLAVQGEFSGALDLVAGMFSDSSGYGLAQVGDKELESLGMAGQDPFDPNVAVTVMESRIESAQDLCINCSPVDLIIVAALAQNGSGQLSDEDIVITSKELENNPDVWWDYIEEESTSAGQIDARVRTAATGMNYKQLLVTKYVMDMRALHDIGWDLPDGITINNLNNIENRARGLDK